jgi:carbon-monoxide dehydrogenase small subunit
MTASIQLVINGQSETLNVPPMKRLLDVLREDLNLTGTKEGCGEGECGSCSVRMNGELVNSCLVPVLQAQASRIQTIEGLAIDAELHPLQKAFLECGGAQCGICTPGMLMAATHLLEHNPQPSMEDIREGLAGNLCRCTGFVKIFEAVKVASVMQASSTRKALHAR